MSELQWKGLEIYQIKGRMDAAADGIAAFRGDVDYGRIYAGENQDSDYAGNNRTLETSRSNNSTDKGSVLDVSAGLGYPWKPPVGFCELTVTPLAGYSYHEQNLTITEGFQTIPATGSFGGLHSEYQPRWKGPWAGVDLSSRGWRNGLFGECLNTTGRIIGRTLTGIFEPISPSPKAFGIQPTGME